MKRFVTPISVLMLAFVSFVQAQDSQPFTIESMMKVRRVGDPQVSPNAKRVAFTIGDVNFDANRVVTQVYVLPVSGGEMKALTSGDRWQQIHGGLRTVRRLPT